MLFRRSSCFTLTAFSLLVLTASADRAHAVDPGPWKKSTTIGLSLSQNSFSSNWRGGDKGSFTWVARLDATASRQLSSTFNWSNSLQLAFGETGRQTGDGKNNRWLSPDKTSDLILFDSVGRFTLGKFLDPYVGFRLDSQFFDQSWLSDANPGRTSISFNPIKLTETAGVARQLARGDSLLIVTRLGLGVRQNLSRYYVGGSNDRASLTTNDGGVDWTTDVMAGILNKRVLYVGKLQVFAPFFYSQKNKLTAFDEAAAARVPGWTPVGNYWKTPDISFQNAFTTSITKLVNVNLYAQFVYDKFDSGTNIGDATVDDDRDTVLRGVRRAGQFRENLGIGLSYQLF